ncbi:protein SLOW GREEN 1, chloroplastic-like isoform X2 [Corylus avellana]|uniref:protein SLOW GREEN 1, chloroplastic-like isoform X2 n=1 Tax=Corylus avellana TaxID=13451 RepID=UPI00286D0408|nr:protein SLOW GREEN 1, chloroplastic-like isoform X2 [Corylus avellana]
MGSTSIAASNLLTHRLGKSLKPPPPFINSPCLHKPLCRPTLPFQQTKLHVSSGHSQSLSFSVPTSKVSHLDNSFSPQKFFSTFLSEKIVVFLIGSFIFMGFCKNRAAIALPAQTSSFSANMEEMRDTQKRESQEEKMYEELLEKDPRNVEALKVVLYGKMRRGKTKEAVKYVERLIDQEPDEVEWRLLMALCYETMGQLSKAKRLFEEILEKRPLLLRALHGLALVMHKNHEGPAVLEMLNKALDTAQREKRVTEERNIKILIAQMHVVKGELDEALKKFQDLVNENPRDFRPYLCQGIIYSLLDKQKEAAEQFETYRAVVPKEFPQRGFLDDVVLAAKTQSREQFQKEFNAEFLNNYELNPLEHGHGSSTSTPETHTGFSTNSSVRSLSNRFNSISPPPSVSGSPASENRSPRTNYFPVGGF